MEFLTSYNFKAQTLDIWKINTFQWIDLQKILDEDFPVKFSLINYVRDILMLMKLTTESLTLKTISSY